MNKNPVAHISDDGRKHNLYDHLIGTAHISRKFAAEFGCGGWGYLAGLWHDLGKYSPEFQKYIRSAGGIDAHIEGIKGRVDHSTAGGFYAVETFKSMGRVFAYIIAGHHAGLPDWESDKSGMASLEQRLRPEKKKLLESARSISIPNDILEQSLPSEKPPKKSLEPASELALSLWVRMLFSCLVDADFLDSEAFFEPERAAVRGAYPLIEKLLSMFDDYMIGKLKEAPNTDVNRIRKRILDQCRVKASEQPGIYTLTVPTGGGKTLSSMSFALNHAVKYHKNRIIYVIPYTSIIEQTANEFRKIFADAVIEHHSNLDTEKESARSRLACENWDAPIIVTTSVQFFESLFASRTSRCRKLHNIINSVVILDEAQLLPPDFLNPILKAITELKQNYGVTFVFSTATQPALSPHKTSDFNFEGLPETGEIVEDTDKLHNELKRVDVRVIDDLDTPQPWEDIARRLREHDSVLCIVNRRDDARTLWELMPEGTFHLSALMCGAHRSEKIAEIKKLLKSGQPVRVISTQLVEAGVDLDFPVVYRALAGLDSIAQAAGRCNREGSLVNREGLPVKGLTYVFTPPSKIPAGHLRQTAEIGCRLLKDEKADPLAPERFETFFREFYWIRGSRLDEKNIIDLLKNDPEFHVSFREAAGKFKLIDDTAYAPVIVCYPNDKLISLLKLKGEQPDRWLKRRLQRYVVNLPRRVHEQLVSSRAIYEIHPGIFIQGHSALYHEKLGFCPDKSIVYEPDELIC
ncbi:MAG: CRISPR-associated endonuclease Cas3'' [Nitrospirae bacterium]|nr:CRISPR-associated endonuclease Cas3'' [Nitrospirota bacterium]